jgi:hypothetical protein
LPSGKGISPCGTGEMRATPARLAALLLSLGALANAAEAAGEGALERRRLSRNVPKDYECYVRRYPDLRAKYCAASNCDAAKLWYHFRTYGKPEGRTYGCGDKVAGRLHKAAAASKPMRQHTGEAYSKLCFYLHSSTAKTQCPPPPWAGQSGKVALQCIDKSLADEALTAGTTARLLRERYMLNCENNVRDWWRNVPRNALSNVSTACAAKGPRVWLAVEIRLDSTSLAYWILWHLFLGVEHSVVYDNDDQRLPVDAADAANLRLVLKPFLRDGVVTIVPFGGKEAAQREAYEDAAKRAAKAGAQWLGAWRFLERRTPWLGTSFGETVRRCIL